jgi:septal ring factor EnvC (AmiA/AmiB activator)
MKKKIVLSFFVGLFLLCLIIAGLTQALGKEQVDKQSINQQMSEMHSAMQETTMVLDLYEKNTLTTVYTNKHLMYLNQNMLSVTDLLQQGDISGSDRRTVKTMIDMATQFSLSLHDVMQSGRDTKTIEKSKKTVADLEKQLEGLEKKYE